MAQQVLFEVIEKRTNTDEIETHITMNSTAVEFAQRLSDAVGPYLLRRLCDRFESIDFDTPTVEGIEFTPP